MSSSRAEFRLAARGSNDPANSSTGHPRNTVDRIALQSDAAALCHEETPEVVELEAACLDAARFEMRGATKALAGDADDANFRAIWRGDRAPVTLREICRVRRLPLAEARRATDAMLSVLLNAGRSADDISMDKVLKLLGESTGCVEALVRKLGDGRISKDEAEELLPAARTLVARVTQIVTSLEVAARMPERER